METNGNIALPEGWKRTQLGDLLSDEQLREVALLVKRKAVTHDALVEIIKKDDSKYKGKVDVGFLAYAVENTFNQLR